jgi:putative spermidine/putrescine transport system permease protein
VEQGSQRLNDTVPDRALAALPSADVDADMRQLHDRSIMHVWMGRWRGTGISIAWVLPAALFLIGFFLLPLLQNGVRSIFPHGLAEGFDLANYSKLFGDPFYLGVLGQTLMLSLMVAAISAVIGYPVAWFMVRHAGRWQGPIIFMLIAPLLTSIIMRTFGWRVLLARFGIVNILLRDGGLISAPIDFLRWPGVAVIALIHVLVPFMVLAISASLQSVDRRLEESARLLGAGPVETFLRITLPLTLDGVATGFILVFMLANGSFVTLLLLGGGWQTLPLLIFQQFSVTHDFSLASAMSMVLLMAAAICMYIQLRLIRRQGVRMT